jgi:hypothetical protein
LCSKGWLGGNCTRLYSKTTIILYINSGTMGPYELQWIYFYLYSLHILNLSLNLEEKESSHSISYANPPHICTHTNLPWGNETRLVFLLCPLVSSNVLQCPPMSPIMINARSTASWYATCYLSPLYQSMLALQAVVFITRTYRTYYTWYMHSLLQGLFQGKSYSCYGMISLTCALLYSTGVIQALLTK